MANDKYVYLTRTIKDLIKGRQKLRKSGAIKQFDNDGVTFESYLESLIEHTDKTEILTSENLDDYLKSISSSAEEKYKQKYREFLEGVIVKSAKEYLRKYKNSKFKKEKESD